MSDPLADLDRQIAALQAQRAALETTEVQPWPKRARLYMYSRRESVFRLGRQLRLSPSACEDLAWNAYEVALEVEIQEDGTYTILTCNGRPLGPPAGEQSSEGAE